MATETTTIAVVEDDAGVRTALGQLLRAADFNALIFGSAEEFLASGLRASVDCLIADINLPGMSGVALLKALAASGPVPPALLITARDDAATRSSSRRSNMPGLVDPLAIVPDAPSTTLVRTRRRPARARLVDDSAWTLERSDSSGTSAACWPGSLRGALQ